MSLFDELTILPGIDITLSHQLKTQLTWLIASGKLKSGEQLPPVKVMAAQLGINLHTVRSAYLRLAEEGLVETRRGRGTHVLPFDPARLARAAGRNLSHTIGLIVPSWTNPFYHALLQGVEEVAEADQTLIFLCSSHDDPQLARRAYARLAARQVDGILVASHDICQSLQPAVEDNAGPRSIPLVSIDAPGCGGYAVQVDLQQAGYQSTRHLVEHGHRRIGLVTYAVDAENIVPVNAGYSQALIGAGITPDPALTARVPGFGSASGIEGARKLLALAQPPTAIFAISDLLALGVLQAARQASLKIPGDIALAGFNDIPAAALVEPPLTTVVAPARQAGRQAMHMLRQLIAGDEPPQKQFTLPTSLITRASCGCPRKDG